ncbi:MAG TPA: pyridoxal-dependent decarboxylase [Planctomycetaceae bacterium]|nr:pyridoxal-dependent decarboxylase [Planctomycetaceae bacterium]|tara:strand:- start:16850 stop:18355 length:1506 start_codon:yes stop_codon:yes gene_type:complete
MFKTDTTLPSERIAQAFSPANLRLLGHRLIDLLSSHLTQVEASREQVLNWNGPAGNIARASQILAEAPQDPPSPEALAERFETLAGEMLARGHNLHDPRYIGHQVPAPVPLAGLFDALGSITNQVMAIYEMGPWATSVERAMITRLGARIGWAEAAFAGLVTHGGSLGNMTALLTARNVSLGDAWERGLSGRTPPPVILVQQDSHYCVARAAGVLGIGTKQVVRVGLDERRRMDPQRLDEALTELRARGVPIVAVSAAACATPIGAFDPLDQIAEVCQKHDVWLHVDAAHGGAVLLSRQHRHLLRGINQVDSLVWDAHKMLFVPALCAFVFYRNAEHRQATFRQEAGYLFDPSVPELADFDSGTATVECTKRAATYGLWGTWSLFGEQLFEDMVDVTFDQTRRLYEQLQSEPDFEPLHVPQCNILAFRYVPPALRGAPEEEIAPFLLKLRRELIRSGEFYIVQAKIGGRQALRVTIINPLTQASHLEGLVSAIRRTGEILL